MIAIIIISSILLLLLFLLFTPVKVEAIYHESFKIKAKYLFVTLFNAPTPEAEAGEKEEEPPVEEEAEKAGAVEAGRIKTLLKKQGLAGFLSFISELAGIVKDSAITIIKHVKIKKFDLYLCIGGEDAAEAAVLYGRACAVVYSAYGMIFSYLKCRKKKALVNLNYKQPQSTVEFTCKIQVRLLFLVTEGVRLLVRGYPYLKKINQAPVSTKTAEKTKNMEAQQ